VEVWSAHSAKTLSGCQSVLSLRLSARCRELLLDFRANLVEPRLAAFGAVSIGSKLTFQLRDTIASGLKLLCQPLRGLYGLPAVLIGRIRCLVQKVQNRLPGLVDKLVVLRITTGVHAEA
jgi:hypothetical protein